MQRAASGMSAVTTMSPGAIAGRDPVSTASKPPAARTRFDHRAAGTPIIVVRDHVDLDAVTVATRIDLGLHRAGVGVDVDLDGLGRGRIAHGRSLVRNRGRTKRGGRVDAGTRASNSLGQRPARRRAA